MIITGLVVAGMGMHLIVAELVRHAVRGRRGC